MTLMYAFSATCSASFICQMFRYDSTRVALKSLKGVILISGQHKPSFLGTWIPEKGTQALKYQWIIRKYNLKITNPCSLPFFRSWVFFMCAVLGCTRSAEDDPSGGVCSRDTGGKSERFEHVQREKNAMFAAKPPFLGKGPMLLAIHSLNLVNSDFSTLVEWVPVSLLQTPVSW